MFDRLVPHADKLRLQDLQKLATEHAEPLGQPMPKQQPLHAEPSPEERASQEVNHLPYASWCESCVMAKGRPEPHTSDPEHLTRREHSVLSFDFSFTGRDPSVLPCLGGVVAPEDKQTVLNVYDSHSGCVFAIPVPLRRDVHFMCRELMNFLQLGYSRVVLRCDAEPVLMKVQGLLQTARQKLGLETLLENGRVRDPGSNAWVENAVNRVRQQAMTLIYHLELQLRMSFPVTHPLFSWCFVHACWLLNRFVPKGGATPFEAVCGREYDGRIACFAEPILAFVGTEPRQKGSAKWMKALFLTKTSSNDMYVVGIGNRVRLTRAVKRIYKDWVPQLEMYQKFGVHSWMVEGALGGRLKPGIAKKPEPHMLNFEDVPGESVPDLDDQVSGDGMILDFDGNQIPYSLMHPSSCGIEGTSVPEQFFALGPVVSQPTSGTVEVQVAELPPRCTEDRDGGDEPASKRARISRLSVNQVEVHHVDDTCMIPDGIDMLDIDGILEHDFRREFDTHTKMQIMISLLALIPWKVWMIPCFGFLSPMYN